MYILDINEGGHKWEKQNLITIYQKGKHFDIFECGYCKIKAKSVNLTTLAIKGSYSAERVKKCESAPIEAIPKRIKITFCPACGPAFENIIPDSEHDVIEPPKGYINDANGVWVMGNGEPVKVLKNEFIKM